MIDKDEVQKMLVITTTDIRSHPMTFLMSRMTTT